MATSPMNSEVCFYSVSCTTAAADWAPESFPCVLVLPDERYPLTEVPQSRWREIRTEPGRWYRFRSVNRPQRVPLTEQQAEMFRDAGWVVEDPRPPRGKVERAVADHRAALIAYHAELPARREAMLELCRQSMRAAAEEAVEQLWLPRLYRKISRQLRPEPWWEVLADYQEKWCESTGTWHRRSTKLECEWIRDPRREGPESYLPDLDLIRCIVFGWADGSNLEELELWGRRWREKLYPAIQSLEPVMRSWVPGPELLAYVTQTLPEIRPQLEEIIDGWPDSPPALLGLLRDFSPAADLLQRFQDQTAPDPAKDARDDRGQGTPYALEAIALGDELQALHRLAARSARLADILADAKRSLETMGWQISTDGKLQQARRKTRGPKPAYLVHVIRGLYVHLRPFYQRTFRDTTKNPAPLRMHISLLLSPYFESAEVRADWKGPIWRAINNHIFP